MNWEQTGLTIVPVLQWTMATQGTKRVEIKGIDDKRQITGKNNQGSQAISFSCIFLHQQFPFPW